MQMSTTCVPKHYGNGLSLEKSLYTLTQSFTITQKRAVEKAKRYELVRPLVSYDCTKVVFLPISIVATKVEIERWEER